MPFIGSKSFMFLDPGWSPEVTETFFLSVPPNRGEITFIFYVSDLNYDIFFVVVVFTGIYF